MESSANVASLVHLTEIAAYNLPEHPTYKYKCQLVVGTDATPRLIEKTLHTRTRPHWLVNITHARDCAIEIFLLYRGPAKSDAWREAGRVTVTPASALGALSSTDVTVPITTWPEAPELALQLRLVSSSAAPTDGATRRYAPTAIADPPEHAAPALMTEPLDTTLTDTPELSDPDKVMIKDTWNKFLAFQELCMEMFLERLLLEEPTLGVMFDGVTDTVKDELFGVLDLAVRALHPHTEHLLRESYPGAHSSPDRPHSSTAAYGDFFAGLGMKPGHWMTARQVWMWALRAIPYIEPYEREDLDRGVDSAFYRFFTKSIISPMAAAVVRSDTALPPHLLGGIRRSWDELSARKRELGIEFYRSLFERHPEVLPYFGRSNMDQLSLHLFQAIELVVQSAHRWNDLLPDLHDLAVMHSVIGVPPEAFSIITDLILELFDRHILHMSPALRRAWRTLFERVIRLLEQPGVSRRRLFARATEFLHTIAGELAWDPDDLQRRLGEVEREIAATGTYTHTYEELAYGAQLAWRNAPKCIGRIQWNNLMVRDRRQVTDPDHMFAELIDHLRVATNNGNVQSVITVFRPKYPRERWGPRLWNAQLVRYAGYRTDDGEIFGDPASAAFTDALLRLGWTPPEPRTAFDVLPVVIDLPGEAPRIYDLPRDAVLEVDLTHPSIPAFASLGLRWYAIPAVSNFRLSIGGVDYACCPFNGWYLQTEIARNLTDTDRYDKLEAIAELSGLDTTSEQTLWRDEAYLHVNQAILHSFQRARVTIVDHHTASQQFLVHDLREKRAGRECPAQWSWVVPPLGGTTCPVYHHEMRDFYLEPHYHYAADRWAVEDGLTLDELVSEHADAGRDDAARMVILYGSETGTAERFARRAAHKLKRHRPRVMALDDYPRTRLGDERTLLVVTSTFGNGDIPGNGRAFLAWLKNQPAGSLPDLAFSVMALGSTLYDQFCAAGIAVDRALASAGADRLVPLHKGDELKGQADEFDRWLDLVNGRLGGDTLSASTEVAASHPVLRVVYSAAGPHSEHRVPSSRLVPLVANRELLQRAVPGDRSTRFVAFDISGTDLTYQTGDHLIVYPHNPPELVARLCARLDLDPDAVFTTRYETAAGAVLDDPPPLPGPMTVRRLLTEELDLSPREPFDELVNALYQTADDADRARLQPWLNATSREHADADVAAVTQHITDTYMSVADVLDEFPSARLTLPDLIRLLPRQKPRFYSISSSPLVHPSTIHLTVGVVTVTTDAGKTRSGLCSHYLAGLAPGSLVRVDVHTSQFRPPPPDTPTLMVGAGTGLAPLRGFLQHRETLLNQTERGEPAEAHLYFGCRDHDDYLYRDELEAWHERGVVSHLCVAFSRRQPKKRYVQHLMAQNRSAVWRVIGDPRAQFYVCGDATMAEQVFHMLMDIARKEGGLSHAAAVELFDAMKAQGRYHADVWGVTLHYKQTISQVRKDKYSQAERWLARISRDLDELCRIDL